MIKIIYKAPKYRTSKTLFWATTLIIFLQPYINSINGYIIKNGGSSILGPAFYLSSIALLVALARPKISNSLLLAAAFWILVISYHLLSGSSSLSNLQNYIKIIYPAIIFLAIKNAYLNKQQLARVLRAVNISIFTYCALIALSFAIDYKGMHGSGYFGFVDANNDLTVLILLWLSFSFWTEKYGLKTNKEIVFLTFPMTLSKAIIFLAPSVIINYFRSTKSLHKKIIISTALTTVLSIVGISVLKQTLLEHYFTRTTQGSFFEWITDEQFWRIITFGRSDFLMHAYENGAFYWTNLIFGNGIQGMSQYLPKIGIEMDLFDSIAQHGIIGITWLIIFYYSPLLFSDIGWRAKLAFSIVVLYSMTGGHFYNNPLVGFYYGLYLALVFNKKINPKQESNSEIRNNNKHTLPLQNPSIQKSFKSQF